MSALELEIFSEESIKKPSAVYLMRDGKLYLNKEALSVILKGKEHPGRILVNLAYNKGNPQDKNIYLLLAQPGDKSAKTINRAGYLASQNFIKSLGIDSKIDSYQYLLEETDYNGKRMFILKLNGKRNRTSRKNK